MKPLPEGPEDISLSETGKAVLEIADRKKNFEVLNALGQSACSELIDARLGAIPGLGLLTHLTSGVEQEARDILGHNTSSFINGMADLQRELIHRELLDEQKVAV